LPLSSHKASEYFVSSQTVLDKTSLPDDQQTWSARQYFKV
jgi:hypothetical protein